MLDDVCRRFIQTLTAGVAFNSIKLRQVVFRTVVIPTLRLFQNFLISGRFISSEQG